MITVTIVFALGGALAVAVSALLAQQGLTAQRYLSDLSRQNAIAAGAAYVAGDGLEVAPPLCPTSRVIPALGQGGEVSGVVCHQVDSIGTGGVGVLPLVWPDRNCSVTPVPSGNQQTLFWLNGAGVVSAYLDNSSAGSCGAFMYISTATRM